MPNAAPPQYCPTPRELDDLELLAIGALAPTVAFGEADSPVTLTLPADVADAATSAGAVELVDPEGLPLARVGVPGGEVTPLTHAQYGPFRRLYLSPARVREQYAGRTVVPVVDALTDAQIDDIGSAGPVLLLALVGHGTPELPPTGLIRATLAAAALMPDAAVIAVPLASHDDAEIDHALGLQVVANYAGPDPVRAVATVVAATVVEEGAPPPATTVVEEGAPPPDTTVVEEGALAPVSKPTYPPAIQAIVDQERPDPVDQGLVLFFTGLSGSGKSTLARALMDRILEQGARTVTSLDGDVVRRHLSAGLTFSKADRETNIRRIGWVAAEISRHGGLAVCSPIAPFDETRQQVRTMVEDAGGAFFLVHVATPLEECERRDRKGLYAKARRGEIPEFTGISSPYEEPEDADVRVDTTGRSIEDALDDVIDALAEAGYLDLRDDEGGFEAQAPGRLRTSTTDPVVEVRGAPATSLETTDPGNTVVKEGAAPPDATVVEEGAAPPDATVVEEGAAPPDATVVEEGALAPVSKPPHPGDPLGVLFVCTANICRSPYMELAARELAGTDGAVVFSGAGTHGSAGGAFDAEMAGIYRQAGGSDGHTFSSRPLTTDLLRDADLVLTAESSHRQFILDDHPALFRKVFTLGQFAEVVRNGDADLAGRELIAYAAEHRGPADPDLDVPDPYRRGPEAARACAHQLDELLRVVVPALTGARRIDG
ncbi:adenylyl-sulfate kinase [Nocardioides sp. LMS-CY]|uniref:adenylyl-sulfate kinase n=1 Tax=Nocardioides sp. (strain LMS-CY) TaxID=2840457 RepID=UPI001BFFDBF1|nr:adenylyl-sulfate kinase [Nocardioides sp. LMS-CY]QWF21697.1 adenylyl-sulfate kinase [Nocardioides sp. LMS-CY]